MTNYRINPQVNVNGFINLTQEQVHVVVPNQTINKIENPSFEMPEYRNDGILKQFNWRFNDADDSSVPYPVTYHHAYSGSFAWKVRLRNSYDYISYGFEKGIIPSNQSNKHDILSFYCYCVDDVYTEDFKHDPPVPYPDTIPSHQHTFVLTIYGMNTQSKFDDNNVSEVIFTHEFTLNSLPKNRIGDFDLGISGTSIPHFIPWERIVYHIPENVNSYNYFSFTIHKKETNPENSYNTYFIIDAVQCEEQDVSESATMYFDGSYEGFNIVKYPLDFQWSGNPYQSQSYRSGNTRVNGKIIGINDYCNFYITSVSGLETPPTETNVFTYTLRDGQRFIDQIIRNKQLTISGRIIANTENLFMQSFAKFQQIIGKNPFSDPEPIRLVFTFSFTNGTTLLPVYLDVIYASGLEMSTANIFQSDVEIVFDIVSSHLQFQNDSATSMMNESPTFDQFNTMDVNILRDIGGFVYYNKSEEKWDIPDNIGFYKYTDVSYTSALPFEGSGISQSYDVKTYYSVGDVHVVKEDRNGIIWIGGRFDVLQIDGYYVTTESPETRVPVTLQIKASNIVGIRKRLMNGTAYVLNSLDGIDNIENGPNLTEVEYFTDWQIITILDAGQRYSQSNELSPNAFIGIPGSSSIVYAIEFAPDGTMYIGGKFYFQYGGRIFSNFAAFSPYNDEAQNVSLYEPESTYAYIATNLGYVDNQYSQSLYNTQALGIYRSNWVNSAIPYCKYGVFTDVGIVGTNTGDSISVVYDIVYDYLNECLYLAGTFVSVYFKNALHTSISVRRLVKYDIATQKYYQMGDNTGGVIGGIAPTTVSLSASIYARKIAIQYVGSGIQLYVIGQFTSVGTTADNFTSRGIAIIESSNEAPNDFSYLQTGGGGYIEPSSSASAVFYDIIITNDDRIFVGGDFNRLFVGSKLPMKATGIAEYRNSQFVDITRAIDANFYPDNYDEFPSVRSLANDSNNNLYFAGNFTNAYDTSIVDSIGKWDGEDFVGLGINFLPFGTKTLQKIFIDSGDNIFAFTGPNETKTTIVRHLYSDVYTFTPSPNVINIWQNTPNSQYKTILKQNHIDIEFYSLKEVSGKTVYVAGEINASVRCSSQIDTNLQYYTDYDTTFIAGKFDYIKIGDISFRVNNLVALRYDESQKPFPFKVLAFSNGITPYYDSGPQGEDLPFIGVELAERNNVVNPTIFSIDVITEYNPVTLLSYPKHLYIGGRFDFFAQGYEEDGETIRKIRCKNFIDIELETLDDDIVFNVPSNYEQDISVPYINYGNYRTPGPAGEYNVNDAVYVVKATWNGFLTGLTRYDPGLVFLGGDFIRVTNTSTQRPQRALQARRLAVYSRNTAYSSFVTIPNSYYKIDLTQDTTASAIMGVATGTAQSSNVFVKELKYTPWRSNDNHQSVLVVGGSWTASGGNPFRVGASSFLNSTIVPLAKIGIYHSSFISPSVYTLPSLLGSFRYVLDGVYDSGNYMQIIGSFVAPTLNQRNIATITGSSNSASVSITGLFNGNWESIYESALGIPYVPSFIQRNDSTGSLTVTGGTGSIPNLFVDKTIIRYNPTDTLYSANYSYGNVNLPQITYDVNVGTSFIIEQPPRKLMQAPSSSVGKAFNLQLTDTNTDLDYSMSIPYQDYTNTLYDAIIMQEFVCNNNGTAIVYPTISIYNPFKLSRQNCFLQVITNVTSRQSLYLNAVLQPNEIVRVRTERERISVISNIRGDITNIIFNSRNVAHSDFGSSDIFHLVPGKNIIRCGPVFPLSRYYYDTLSNLNSELIYDYNENVVVPNVIVSMSWNISFNSIHDAMNSTINPILL